MDLDDLDTRILEHFGRYFPKPERLGYCPQDSSDAEIEALCHQPRLFEDSRLLTHFWMNNRHGLVGNHADFPAFAGDLAVYLRRHLSLVSGPGDLLGYYFHASPSGRFTGADHALLREWIEDILLPWHRPGVERLYSLDDSERPVAIAYLGLYDVCGGDPAFLLDTHMRHSEETATRTPLLYTLGPLAEPKEPGDAACPVMSWFQKLSSESYIRDHPAETSTSFDGTRCADRIVSAMQDLSDRLLEVW